MIVTARTVGLDNAHFEYFCQPILEPRSESRSSPSFKRLEFDKHTLGLNFSLNMRLGLQMNISSFQDTPIENVEEDLMGIGDYAKSLSHFIISCETPMTIGIQGNWGTGKTSLMKLLKKQLDSEEIFSIWINSWEHSVFVDAADITPQILLTMAKDLNERKREDKKGSKHLFQFIRKYKAVSAAEDFFDVGKNALNQFLNKTLGVDIKKAMDEEQFSPKTSPVAKIRNAMSMYVKDVVGSDKNAIRKVVFFIDDLDRVKPSEAVEVIEALKNVFDDIPHCVFVLAIDYEVIKKGLKTRYDTQDADREFRSFFDKMIQVPFRMPTAAMQVNRFIEEKLVRVGVDNNDKYFARYTKVLTSSIGHNPRSLKRFFNTYSLQRDILGETRDQSTSNYLLAILNSLEIAFPKSWSLFLENHKPDHWEDEQLRFIASELNLDSNYLNDRDQVSFSQLIDDQEKIPALFKELHQILTDREDGTDDPLPAVLKIVKITSKDDEVTTKNSAPKAREETDIETHFEYHKLRQQRHKTVFEDLVTSLKDDPDVDCKVARTQCSIRKRGCANSVYIKAQQSKIKMTTMSQLDEDSRRQEQIFKEFISERSGFRISKNGKRGYELRGDFSYDTPADELLETLKRIVILHAGKFH